MLNQLKDFVVGIKDDPEVAQLDETSIKQTIIMKVLHLLGWDTFNRREVVLEYTLDTKKVDMALFCNEKCHVLLEAKNGGEDLDRHQEQLLNYAFRKGVDLAVLTNGLAWWFYLPTKSVDWRSRKFYAIDLLRQDTNHIVNRFEALLGKAVVSNGEALRHAEQMYESGRKKLLTDAYLPKAWNKIVEDPDSLLVELISETTESLCGYKPDESEVTGFLKGNASMLRIAEDKSSSVVQPGIPGERTPFQGPVVPDTSVGDDDHDAPGEKAAYDAVKHKVHNDTFEIAMSGKQRQDVSRWLNKYELLRQ